MKALLKFVQYGVLTTAMASLALLAQPVNPGQPRTDQTTDSRRQYPDSDHNFGWVGLLGLAGLAGLMRGARRDVRDTRDPNVR